MHHRDPIGELRNDGKIVRHQDHAHVSGADQSLQQQQYLRLRDDIQSRGGLIRDEELRRQHDRHGNGHALALAAG